MSINGVTSSVAANAYAQTQPKAKKADNATEKVSDKDVAVLYEKSAGSAHTFDSATVEKLKNDLAYKQQQFAGLVEKLMGKQAGKQNSVLDLLKGLKEGTVKVDQATAEQAQKEIGENGYWGVEQTSNRLLEMAQALSGGDASKADKMIAAMEKGFKQATKAFGSDLPDICRQTIDAAREKINKWKDSISGTTTEQ